jgi:bis(5'-nucleosyl)-tetraphosphatase (symmetrical)
LAAGAANRLYAGFWLTPAGAGAIRSRLAALALRLDTFATGYGFAGSHAHLFDATTAAGRAACLDLKICHLWFLGGFERRFVAAKSIPGKPLQPFLCFFRAAPWGMLLCMSDYIPQSMSTPQGRVKQRRIFIGDIHGCRVELERLLELVNFDPAADELHPVGDLVNRGPDSLGCLRLLRDLKAGGVLGNHDLHLLKRHAGQIKPAPGDTLEPLLKAPDVDELCLWLSKKPFALDFKDLLLIHAGVNPEWTDPARLLRGEDPLNPSENARFAASVRHCTEDGSMVDRKQAQGTDAMPWHAFFKPENIAGRSVVFGHWAAQGLWLKPHLRGLDSGCVWGKKLTAWIAEEDRVLQVPAEKAHAKVK